MKKYIMAVLISLSALQVVALVTLKKDPVYRDARRNGAQTKIELHIQDDGGTPVPDAKIKAYLGMNFRPLGTWINGTTDTNGVFVLEGKTCGDEIEVFVAKDGYYGSHVIYRYAKMGEERDVKDGKWQPYGAAEKIGLRKIKNPIRLVSNVESMAYDFSITVTNVAVGFDMMKNDWVAPYGAGDTPDFYLEFRSDGLPPNASRFAQLIMTYSEPFGAVYEVPVATQSNFKGCYTVNGDKFGTRPFLFENRMTESGRQIDRLGENRLFVVRSRCKVDEHGRLVSANYATLDYLSFSTSFKGPGGCRLCYHFNPTPNDMNLEAEETARRPQNFSF